MKHKIDDIDKKEIFKVPEGYFENLSLKIQQRVSSEQKPQRIRVSAWSMALVASVLLFITFVFILSGSNPSTEELLADIPQDELVAYLDQIELDEFEIASVLGDEASELEFDDMNVLDGIDLGNQAIDDVLLEYDLEDEYL